MADYETEIDIANTACALIGEDPVQDLDTDLGGGQSAGLLYGLVVDHNLGLNPAGFSFAREVRQLSLLAGETSFAGYAHVFVIPPPFTGPPVFLTDDPSDPCRVYRRFTLSNGRVHAADNPLYAMVKFRPTPDRWSGTFRNATVHALAAKLAWAISSNKGDHDRLNEIAYGNSMADGRGGLIRNALSEDGFATPARPARWDDNPLTNAWRS